MRGVECPGQWRHEQCHVAAHVADDEQVDADGRRSQRRGHQLQPDGQRHADPHLACAHVNKQQVSVISAKYAIPHQTYHRWQQVPYGKYTKHTAVAHKEVSMLSNEYKPMMYPGISQK